jgi:hypothetical protein
LVVAVLIGLLAGASLTALAGARRTSSSYDRFRRATRAADVLAFSPDGGRLARIARLPQVAASWVGRGYPTFVDIENDFDITILAGPGNSFGRSIAAGRYLAGRPPRPDRAEEVAVNPAAAAQLGVAPGQVVMLQSLSPEQIAHIEESFSGQAEGPRLRLRVTGIVRNAPDLQSQSASSLVYGTPAFHRAYSDSVGSFAAFAMYRLAGGPPAFPAFAGQARSLLGGEGDASLTSAADVSQAVNDSLRVLVVGLVAMGLAALVVAAVVGGQALSRQLWLAGPEQAALGALGLRRRDRAAGVTLVAVPVAGAAALIAGAVAVLASPLTPINIGRQAEPDPGVAVDPLVHGLGALATGGFVVVAAAVIGWRLAGSRGEGRTAPTRPTLATRLARSLHLGPTPETGVRMALERGGGRSAAPVGAALAASILAVGGLAGALTFGASLDRLVDDPVRYGYGWDLQPDLDLDEEEVAAALRRPEVAAVGVLHFAEVVVEGTEASAYAIEQRKGRQHFTVIDGREPTTASEAALGGDLMDRLGKRLGDPVALAGARRPFRIVGTVVTPSQDQDPLAAGVVVTPAALETVKQSEGEGQAILTWRRGRDVAAAERRLRADFPMSISAYSHPRVPGEVVNLDRASALPLAFAGFLATVGIAALAHALFTSARRHRHALAVLRTLGFVRRQVAGALGWQATTIAAVGLAVGLPLGVALGRWIWVLVADGVGVATDPRIPIATGGLVLGGALLVANVVGLPLGVRASRSAPAEALRAE